ncbi:hypothetical protein IWQ62_006550, partial [Dispira parvispora]
MVRVVLSVTFLALLAQTRAMVNLKDEGLERELSNHKLPKGMYEVDCSAWDETGKCIEPEIDHHGSKSTGNTGNSEHKSTAPRNEAMNVGWDYEKETHSGKATEGYDEELEEYAEHNGHKSTSSSSHAFNEDLEEYIEHESDNSTSTRNTAANDVDTGANVVEYVDAHASVRANYQCGKVNTGSGSAFVYSAWGHYCSASQYSHGIGTKVKPLFNFLPYSPEFVVAGNITVTRYENLEEMRTTDLKYEWYYTKNNLNREDPYATGCVKATGFNLEFICFEGKFLYFSQTSEGIYEHHYATLAAHASRLRNDDCEVEASHGWTQQKQVSTYGSTNEQYGDAPAPINEQFEAAPGSTQQKPVNTPESTNQQFEDAPVSPQYPASNNVDTPASPKDTVASHADTPASPMHNQVNTPESTNQQFEDAPASPQYPASNNVNTPASPKDT